MNVLASDYVARLAAAITQVNAAHDRLLQDIDTASRQPALLRDSAWQVRSRLGADMVKAAADQLRVEPVPESMRVVDEALARAQQEGHLASQSHFDSLTSGSSQAIMATVQHLDRMSQLIQQAYALIRG